MSEPSNPLDMGSLAQSIITRLLESEPTRLDRMPRFTGAGLYAIYYSGPFPAYAEARLHPEQAPADQTPLYVGKAVSDGGRRGLDAAPRPRTTALSRRLRELTNSLSSADSLDIADFSARWLVVDDIWIALGESALIRRYRPVWNAIVDGFGNHDPGRGRVNGVRSRWDTLHPGRAWRIKYPERPESPSEIEQEVREYLRSRR